MDTPRRSRWSAAWPLALLASVAVLVYLPTLGFAFTYFDDDRLILERQQFLRDPRNVAAAFRQDVFHAAGVALPYYRPLLTLSFLLDAQWGGSAPLSYHLTNVLLHAVVSALVFALLTALGHRRAPALAAALVFAVHPTFTLAVAWVPGRNDLLLALFSLAAFLALLAYFERRRIWALALHCLFVLSALLTKETALALLPLFWLYAWGTGLKERHRMNAAVLGSGYLVLGVVWWMARQFAFSQAGFGVLAAEGPALRRLLARLPELLSTLGDAVWPAALNVFATEHLTAVLVGWAAAVALAVALLCSRERCARLAWFGLSWFLLLQLLPLAAPVLPFLLPHRLYLPMVGLLIAALEVDWLKRLTFRPLPASAVAAVVLTLVLLTRQRLPVFASRIAFWEQAVAAAPQASFARANLGRVYLLEGRLAEAKRESATTLALNPWQYAAHNNLGVIAQRQGQLDEAEVHYRQELSLHPYDHAFYNLGNLAFRRGQAERAAWFWRTAIEVNPEYLDAYVNLAAYHERRGEAAQTQRYLEEFTRRGGRLQ